MDPFLGQLLLVPFNFPPKGWAFCQGQLLAISQNQALFSLLGTTYGGNGIQTFALPDLRSRVPVSSGQGPGLGGYILGQTGGVENVTLLVNQMPAHTHPFNVSNAASNASNPTGNLLGDTGAVGLNIYTANPTSAGASLNASAIGTAGGSQPHTNLSPYLALNWIIALQGIFPSRN